MNERNEAELRVPFDAGRAHLESPGDGRRISAVKQRGARRGRGGGLKEVWRE